MFACGSDIDLLEKTDVTYDILTDDVRTNSFRNVVPIRVSVISDSVQRNIVGMVSFVTNRI